MQLAGELNWQHESNWKGKASGSDAQDNTRDPIGIELGKASRKGGPCKSPIGQTASDKNGVSTFSFTLPIAKSKKLAILPKSCPRAMTF